MADATYIDEHSDLARYNELMVDSWFEYWISMKKRTAGIERFSMHILRHTFATRCIEAGMKPKTLQILLGHSNIGITMNLYVYTTEEEKKKEIDMVAEALKVI